MTTILGISAFYHDSAAALVVDGDIVAAAQEERFTRKKHDAGFPDAARSTTACARPGCRAGDLDYVAFYDKPLLKFERLLETYLAFAPAGFASFRMAMPVWLKEKLHLPRVIRERLGASVRGAARLHRSPREPRRQRVLPVPVRRGGDPHARRRRRVEHDDAAASGAGNTIELTHQLQFPHSLGLLYSAFTYYCGFKVNSGEYKLMGLAPYGQPDLRGPDPRAPDRPQARRQLLAGHAVLQLLPGPDDDEPAVPRAVRRPAAQPGVATSSSGTWTWRRASRR